MTKSVETVRIADFTVEADGLLRRATGEEIVLRPQTRQVLAVLARNAGELVTKDALMRDVWGDTHVTDDSLVQCISEIRKALGPEDGKRLRTVPRRGYLLEPGAPGGEASPVAAGGRRGRWVAALLAVAVVAAAFWALMPRGAPTAMPAEARVVAVLPFENIGGDDTYDYFASGIAEDLIVSLTRLPDIRTVALSAAAALSAETADPRVVAGDLGARFLVDGSVRRQGDRLKLTAALIDGETGENLWAERYEGGLADVFGFQDEVLGEIVRVLAVRLSAEERRRLGIRGTESIAAYDAYLRGLSLETFLTPVAHADAVAAFREAVRADPGYAAAHAHLSLALSMSAEYEWAEDEGAVMTEALRHAEEAVALDPGLTYAHFVMGRLRSRSFFGDIEGALAAFRSAIGIDPDYADAYAFMANVLVFDGRAAEAREMIGEAIARNPVPPYWYGIPLGLSSYQLGDYETAAEAFRGVLDRNPNSPHALRHLIATYGRMGEAEEAEWLAFEYESLGMTATVSGIMEAANVSNPDYRAALAEGLRMAGLPE